MFHRRTYILLDIINLKHHPYLLLLDDVYYLNYNYTIKNVTMMFSVFVVHTACPDPGSAQISAVKITTK